MTSAEERYTKQRVSVKGREMAYVEVGEGDPIVFLHGNPTSSYLWRNIIPHLEGVGCCIAPDLIGMGDSEKLEDSGPGRYRFEEHREYLDDILAELGVVFLRHVLGHLGAPFGENLDVAFLVGVEDLSVNLYGHFPLLKIYSQRHAWVASCFITKSTKPS